MIRHIDREYTLSEKDIVEAIYEYLKRRDFPLPDHGVAFGKALSFQTEGDGATAKVAWSIKDQLA